VSIQSCPWSRLLSPKPYRIGSLRPPGVQDMSLLLQRNMPYFTEPHQVLRVSGERRLPVLWRYSAEEHTQKDILYVKETWPIVGCCPWGRLETTNNLRVFGVPTDVRNGPSRIKARSNIALHSYLVDVCVCVCVWEGHSKGLNERKLGISISQSKSRVSSHEFFNWSLSASSLVFGSS